MFGISGFELFLILGFALLIFGPDKLPQIGRTIGRFMSDFKRMQQNMEQQIRAEMYSGVGLPQELDTTPGRVERPKSKAASSSVIDDEDEEEEEE